MNTKLMADFLIWCDQNHQEEINALYDEFKSGGN